MLARVRASPQDLHAFVERCRGAGFDLCGAARVGDYNARLAGRPEFLLPDLGRADHCVLVVGNTAALWPRLLATLEAEPERCDAMHPLDDYCRQQIGAAADATARALAVPHRVRYASDSPPEAVAMQHLAEVAGLAQTAPCNLSVHPRFGPWIALRAAAVFALEAPRAQPRATPCSSCADRPCRGPFEEAMAETWRDEHPGAAQRIARHYRRWLAVRDACPLGREHRYSEPQLDYHYLKDRKRLRRLLQR